MPVRNYTASVIDQAAIPFAFPEFGELLECRELIDDCLAGQKTVKERGKYLPPTKWQESHPEKYVEFLFRALFPNETKYSLDVYEGLFHLGMPVINLPVDGRMNYLQEDASVFRDGLKEIQVRLNKEQMSHGLRCMLLEVAENQKRPFFIQEYSANKFIRSHFVTIDGESAADMVLLNETRVEYNVKEWKDEFIPEMRLLALDANGEYYQRKVDNKEIQSIDVKHPPMDNRTVYPEYHKRRFNRIPFVWCGATSLSGIAMDYPPLLPMAQTELKMFLCMAHHSQHIYMNTQEAIVITGANQNFKLKDDDFVAGSVVVIPGENTKAQYLSTNGVGFDAEEKEIERLQNSIESKRLSLMNAKSHQSGTVVGMVQNSQSAPLRTTVTVSGNAITQILRYMAEWMGYPADVIYHISYTPSTEFANPKVNMSEFISLCKAVEDGDVKMLEEDLYTMAKESGFITGRMSWEEFKKKYDIEQLARERKNAVVIQAPAGNPFQQVKNDEKVGE